MTSKTTNNRKGTLSIHSTHTSKSRVVPGLQALLQIAQMSNEEATQLWVCRGLSQIAYTLHEALPQHFWKYCKLLISLSNHESIDISSHAVSGLAALTKSWKIMVKKLLRDMPNSASISMLTMRSSKHRFHVRWALTIFRALWHNIPNRITHENSRISRPAAAALYWLSQVVSNQNFLERSTSDSNHSIHGSSSSKQFFRPQTHKEAKSSENHGNFVSVFSPIKQEFYSILAEIASPTAISFLASASTHNDPVTRKFVNETLVFLAELRHFREAILENDAAINALVKMGHTHASVTDCDPNSTRLVPAIEIRRAIARVLCLMASDSDYGLEVVCISLPFLNLF